MEAGFEVLFRPRIGRADYGIAIGKMRVGRRGRGWGHLMKGNKKKTNIISRNWMNCNY